MSQKDKTFGMRIRDALRRNRPDIANEVRIERNETYSSNMTKLSSDYARQLQGGQYLAAQKTLKKITIESGRMVKGLGIEVKHEL